MHGQWREQRSALSHQRYAYDRVGRLTRVEDTPAGQGCSTRSYAFDADSNRTRKTTRGPGSGGACDTTSAGQSSDSSYDAAHRMTDTGVQYDPSGRMTEVPGSRAGGGVLSSTYYVNDQIRSGARGWAACRSRRVGSPPPPGARASGGRRARGSGHACGTRSRKPRP